MVHQEDFLGLCFDGAGDTLPMLSAEDQRPKDQKIKSALQKGNALLLLRSARVALSASTSSVQSHAPTAVCASARLPHDGRLSAHRQHMELQSAAGAT